MKKVLIYIMVIAAIVFGIASCILAFLIGKDMYPRVKAFWQGLLKRFKYQYVDRARESPVFDCY